MELSVLEIIEIIAVASGITHVYLLTREKIIAWPFGLLSVGLYIYIFAEARLYSDMLLHFIYVLLNIYGWWNWANKRPEEEDLPVTRLNRGEILIWSVVIIAGFLAWGTLMKANTNADFPYPDAFTTVASLVAQFLLARKKLDNWVIWIIVDVVAINIYALKGLYFTTGLYVMYLLLSAKGWWDWRKSLMEQQA